MEDYGILLIDKPEGLSSFDVIRKLRKLTKIKKIGHTGTLDPFATGLLVLCLGKATKVASKLITEKKEYLARMKLGIKTDSGDLSGKIIKKENIPNLNEAQLKDLKSRVLKINKQIPPKFSAIKHKGKRAYEYARKEEEIELQPRTIRIYEFEFTEFSPPYISYRTTVSKGTYIRVLSEQLAEELGTLATTVALRRTAIADIKLAEAEKLEDLDSVNWREKLIPITEVLKNFPRLEISRIDDFRYGRPISVRVADKQEVMVTHKEKCIGFAKIEKGYLQPKQVFI